MDTDLLRSLLAGWIAGAAAGMVGTGVVLVMMVQRPNLARRMPGQGNLPVIGIVVANALMFVLTLVGLILGALFHRAGGEEVALRFALVVVVGAIAVAGLYAFVRGSLRTAEAPIVLVVIGISALSFGILLPFLGSLDS